MRWRRNGDPTGVAGELMHSLRGMVRRRSRNEPRRRVGRARRRIRAARLAEEELFRETAPTAQDSQVLARRRAGQTRVELIHPTRLVSMSFAILCSVGTILLLLPGMTTSGQRASLGDALFTAVSAGCVTGLTVVDTGSHWTPLGQVVILLLIQVGGFGIQALGTLLGLMLNRRMGMASRLAAQTETGALTPGDVRSILKALAVITVVVESAVAVLLCARLVVGYGMGLGDAAWSALFHSVSAFNNAGFALARDSLTTYGTDPLMLAPIALAVIIGGLGFLVVLELYTRATAGHSLIPHRHHTRMSLEDVVRRGRELARRSRYRLGDSHPERFGFANPIPLSLHTRLMLTGTAILMVIGFIGFVALEWANSATLGPLPWWEKVWQSLFSGSITPRTAGFSTVDYGLVRTETRFLTDGLMFTGGGSGSTAGGIKVTTVMVLAMAVLAEVRGHAAVNSLDRRIPDSAVRVAVAVTMVSFAAVMMGTMALITLTRLSLDEAMFEVISALATVGLSTGATPQLPEPAQLLLVLLMLLGRIGPLTLASALALRQTHRDYRLPEGRPLIG